MEMVAQRRAGAQALQTAGLWERRNCQPQARDDAAVIARLRVLALQNQRIAARRMYLVLRQERPTRTCGGAGVNHKRVHRLWRQAGLQLPARPKRHRKRTARLDGPVLQAERPIHFWSCDFLEDATGDGRRLRLLTLEDEFTRECLAIEVYVLTDAMGSVRLLADASGEMRLLRRYEPYGRQISPFVTL
jgi:putative transposase